MDLPLQVGARRQVGRSRGSSADSGSANGSQESNVLASLRRNYQDQINLQTQSSMSKNNAVAGATTGPESTDNEQMTYSQKYRRKSNSPAATATEAINGIHEKHDRVDTQTNDYDKYDHIAEYSAEKLRTDS